MRLRSRVAVAATVAVLVSVVGVSLAGYVSIGNELRRQVDVTLREQGDRIAAVPQLGSLPPAGLPRPDDLADSALFTDSYFQELDGSGEIVASVGDGRLPSTAAARRVASGDQRATLENVTVAGDRVRVYTVPTSAGALRFGRSLDEVDRSLDRLMVAMVVVGLAGITLAAFLGRLLTSKAIAPVHQLSDAARTIKQTGDLSRRLPVHGRDEVASMAASFNEVLDDLEASQAVQRQLVADASHELRTPLTTLRTNIEVLARDHDLPGPERELILSDLTDQLEDFTVLVGNLIDLARDDAVETPSEPVRLDEVVSDVVERARRQRPGIRFVLQEEPCVVEAAPDRLDRAVSNLVDNAAKWTPIDGEVRVTVASGTVTVSDDGPGIEPDDLPHIFDRFYRSPAARQMPGSGLGLAIVKQVADSLGGEVRVRSEPGAGATMSLHLPAGRLHSENGAHPATSLPTVRPD
jgi:two-component system sensor histidine kinase MprB